MLNLNGPFIFNRRHIAELTLKQYVDMKKVTTPAPPLGPLCLRQPSSAL